MTSAASHYETHTPDWFTRHLLNPFLNLLMRLGLSMRGSRVLEHRGRTSGELHYTPVNLLTIDGTDYLVAPRGETQWVRNVRAAEGNLVLILGRKRQIRTATEVPVSERPAILKIYLNRWKSEVGRFFDGLSPDASDAEFAAVAERHPVFSLR
jgi:deazaflavin-dependent oxidoreductase (nitroreductase family)